MKKSTLFILFFVSILSILFLLVIKKEFVHFFDQKIRSPPSKESTWYIQLQGGFKEKNVDLYVLDLFDNNMTTIGSLKEKGKYVICYFSAGTAENWREDYWKFKEKDMGKNLIDWPGERWLDTRSSNVREIMLSRLDIAKNKGCDGVDPDNMDAYSNDTDLSLTRNTQIEYNIYIAKESHKRGLLVGLKNDVSQINFLSSYFDFAINEQCFMFDECEGYGVFASQNKPVFNIEYSEKYIHNINGARDTLCKTAKEMNISTIVSSQGLDGVSMYSCK